MIGDNNSKLKDNSLDYFPIIIEDDQLVVFRNKEISTNFWWTENPDQFFPIGDIFSIAFRNCLASKEIIINRSEELRKLMDSGDQLWIDTPEYDEFKLQLEEYDQLQLEVNDYKVLALAVSYFIHATRVDENFMYLFYSSFSDYRNQPFCHYGYAEDFGEVHEPCLLFEEYINNPEKNKSWATFSYSASTDLQLCVVILDYIYRKGFILRVCETCEKYFIPQLHGNEAYCCDECRHKGQRRNSAKSDAAPLRRAWKQTYQRIKNNADIRYIKANELELMDETKTHIADALIQSNDKRRFIELLKAEYIERKKKQSNEEIISWLKKIAHKRK